MAVVGDSLAQLIQRAGAAANEGRWQDAERLWSQVRQVDPGHPQALYSLGIHALQRGDSAAALDLLRSAQQAAPADPLIPLSVAMVLRERGDVAGEWEAIHQALAIDAYFLPGLLGKAALIERASGARPAAAVYRNALKVAPPEPHWPAVLRGQLLHARAVVEQYQEEFAAFLAHRIEAPRSALQQAAHGRWDEAASIMAGRTRPYLPDCNQLYVPRLPAVPFFDPALFDWVPELESRTDAIREELEAVLREQAGGFEPYVAYKPGDPVNQWQELNHSSRWNSYKLWNNGVPVEEHLAHCPQTAAALREVEMAQLDGLCPNAMFSVLAPHTHIPPHHGETNARVVVHLPLIVPEGCSYRVGFERRQWQVGKVLVFDDSIEHEARNDSDQQRVVLIFDTWNPLLGEAERSMVQAMLLAAREFAAGAER